MKPLSTTMLAMILSASLVCAWPARAQNVDFAVVVNVKNPVTNLTVADLRNLFGGEKRTWPGGAPVKPFVRGIGTEERRTVLKLLGMSESEYKQHWISQVFRGNAQAEPPTLPSNGMQKEAVAAFPGGIALMNSLDVKPGMKVVRVNGHLPGELPYPLH